MGFSVGKLRRRRPKQKIASWKVLFRFSVLKAVLDRREPGKGTCRLPRSVLEALHEHIAELCWESASRVDASVLAVSEFFLEALRRGPGIIAKDGSGRRAEEVQELRLDLALVDAEDGRFVDALNALDRLVNERRSDPRPRICASMICCFVGLPEVGKEFVVGIPDDILQENQVYHRRAVMAATLGGAPCAIAGLEGLVASMAFKSINSALEAKYLAGGGAAAGQDVHCEEDAGSGGTRLLECRYAVGVERDECQGSGETRRRTQVGGGLI
ncbi:hypothetical protein ACQ4PT_035319 [Festuca glaucescens]